MSEYDQILGNEQEDHSNPYDALVTNQDEHNTQQRKTALAGAARKNPEHQAEVQRLARQTNLPAGVVDREYKQVKAQHTGNEYDQILAHAPKTAKWLQNKNNADVASDDVGNVAKVEHTTQDLPTHRHDTSKNGILTDIGHGLVQAGIDLPASVEKYGMALPAMGAARIPQAAYNLATGDDSTALTDFVAKHAVAPIDRITQHYKQADPVTGTAGKTTRQAGTALGDLALMFTGGAGAEVPEITSTTDALVHAATQSLRMSALPAEIQGAQTSAQLQKAGAGTAESNLAGLNTALASPFVNMLPLGAQGGLLFRMATGALESPALTRLMSSATNAPLSAKYKQHNDGSDYAIQAGIDSLMAGLLGPRADVARGHYHAAKAAIGQDKMDAAAQAAQNSKTVKRAPDQVEDLIKDAQGTDTLQVPTNAWNQYFQSEGQDPRQAYSDVTGSTDGYDEASASGSDLSFPTEQFISRVASDPKTYNGLRNDVRIDPEGMTPNEAEQYRQQHPDLQAEIQKQMDAADTGDTNEVFNEVQGQLLAAGEDSQVADHHARLVSAFTQTIADNTGMTPMQVYTRNPLHVSKGMPDHLKSMVGPDETLSDMIAHVRAGNTDDNTLGTIDDMLGRAGIDTATATDREIKKGLGDTTPESAPSTEDKPRNQVTLSNGDKIDVQGHVVDASDLQTSHNASGHVNPDYPAALQPRDRSRVTSDAQIQHIANNLDPALLGDTAKASDGAPIVGSDGAVESGNARINAIRTAYDKGTADAYRHFVEQKAKAAGIDTTGMKQPVYVRQRVTPMDEQQRAEFGRAANQSDISSMAPTEQAKADAARLTNDDLATFSPSETGNVLAPSNEPFLLRFAQHLGGEQASGLRTADGRWNKQMADRVQAAMFYRAYHDDRLLALSAEEADPDMRNILRALQEAAPDFARARDANGSMGDLDTAKIVTDAVEKVRESRRRGQNLDNMLSQEDAFTAVDPNVNLSARTIDQNIRSGKRLGEYFKTIANRTHKYRVEGTDSLFGDTVDINSIIAAAQQELGHVALAQGRVFGDQPPGDRSSEQATLQQSVDGLTRLPDPELTVRELTERYRTANEVHPRFQHTLTSLAEKFETHALVAPLKAFDRALSKVANDYKGDASKIKDLVRGTIVAKTWHDTEQLLGELRNTLGEPMKAKNTLDPSVEPFDPSGYRGANTVFVMDGEPVEIQINTQEMLDAKDRAHEHYVERSELQRSIENEQREAYPEEESRLNDLDNRMRQLYSDAWRAATNALKRASDIGSPSSRNTLADSMVGGYSAQDRATPLPGTIDQGTPSTTANRALSGNESDATTDTSNESVQPNDPDFNELQEAAQAYVLAGTDPYGQQADLFGHAYPGGLFEQRSDTNDAQRDEGRDAIRALEARVFGWRQGAVLGMRMLGSYRTTGGNALNGQTVRTPEDLAALAQVYRDPRYETFRVLYMKGNEVAGENAYTSRLPGAVRFDSSVIPRIAEDKQKFEADGYYLLHNHPSGNPTPSTADRNATNYIAQHFDGFRGHVVVDYNQYAVLPPADSDGTMPAPTIHDIANESPVAGTAGSKQSMLGHKIIEPKDLANVAKSVDDQDSPVYVTTNSQSEVQALFTAPMGDLLHPGKRETVQAQRAFRESGSGGRMFAILPSTVHDGDIADIENNARNGLYNELFSDIITRHGSMADQGIFAHTGDREPRTYRVAEQGDLFGTGFGPTADMRQSADEAIADKEAKLDAADRPENFTLTPQTRSPEQAATDERRYTESGQSDLYGGAAQAAQQERGSRDFMDQAQKDGLLPRSKGTQTLFQSEQPRNLYVTHNTTANGIKAANRLGGMAAPSLAVANLDNGAFDNFGDISLVAHPDILDTPKVKTFDADIYSPRQPRPEYKTTYKAVQAIPQQYGEGVPPGMTWPNMDDIERDGASAIARSDGVQWAYLRSIGKEPKPVKRRIDPLIKQAVGQSHEELDRLAKRYHDKEIKRAAEMDRKREADGRRGGFADMMREQTYNEDGSLTMRAQDEFRRLVRDYETNGDIDPFETKRALAKRVHTKARDEGLRQYAEKISQDVIHDQRLFKGFTAAGQRRYAPYDLKNVLREMTRKLQGGENWNYGAGTVRAHFAKELKSRKAIQAERDRIVSDAHMKDVSEQSQERLQNLLESLKPNYKFDSDSFAYMDDASLAIAEGGSALRETFNLDDDARKRIQDFTNYLRALPTGYFEAKAQRAVGLDEFHTAVVPRTTDKETLDLLKQHGLKIRHYKTGDAEDRTRAIRGADKKLLFQSAYHGTPHRFDKFSLDAIGTGEGAQAFGWGLYFASRKDVADYYKNTLANKVQYKGRTYDFSTDPRTGDYAGGYKHNSLGMGIRALMLSGGDKEQAKRGGVASPEAIDRVDYNKIQSQGSLYQVDIPESYELMDWDARLKDQPKKVRDALAKYDPDEYDPDGDDYDPDEMGQTTYMRIASATGGHREASHRLNELGITGLKYRDAGSRYTTGDSHNYVIWDEDAVSVKSVNDELRQAGDGSTRGQIQFGPRDEHGTRPFHIDLLDGADRSTFIHELGHYIFEVMGDYAEMDGSPQELQDDYNTLLKHLGVDSRSEVGTKQHEELARTFEAYVMEGTAPSKELRGPLSRMRTWLLDIYKTVKNLNINLTDDVRGVFDRLLASHEQIAEAKKSQHTQRMFGSAAQAGMTEQQYQAYLAAGERADAQAETDLSQQTMEAERRHHKEWWNKERKETLQNIQEQTRQQPDYQALTFIRTGALPDGTIPDALRNSQGKPYKLDKQSLINDGYSKHYIEHDLKNTYAADGLTPDQMAEVFGIGSGDELIQKLADPPDYKAQDEAAADASMTQRYGDPLADLHDRAIKAVRDHARDDVMSRELEALGQLSGRTGYQAKQRFLKAAATHAIESKPIKDIKPITYRRAAAKAANEAYKYALANRHDDAFRAKRREMLNTELFRAANRARDEAAKIRRYARTFDKKAKRQRIGKAAGDYLERIDDLLGQYEFRQVSNRRLESRESLRQWLDARDEPTALPTKVLDEVKRQNWREVPMDELRGVYDALKQIDHLANTKYKLQLKQEQRDLDEVVGEVVGSIYEHGKVRPQGIGADRSRKERIRQAGKHWAGLVLNADTFLREMDGFENLGPNYRHMKGVIDRANSERVIPRDQQIGEDLENIYLKHYTRAELQRLEKGAIYIPEVDESFSRDQILSMALHQGNAGNKQALLDGHTTRDGRQLTQDDVDAITDKLEKKDWDFAQDIIDYMESFWPEIQEAQRRRVGVAPPKVEATPIQTKFGEYKGGYYPLKYDQSRSIWVSDEQLDDAMKDLRAGRFASSMTKYGHNIERVGSGGRPIRMDLGVITQHLKELNRDLELGDAINYSYKVMQDPRVRQAFEETGNKEVHGALDIWLKDTAAGEMAASKGLESWIKHARTGFTASLLGWKVSTALSQQTGYFQSAQIVGPLHLMNGLYYTMRGVAPGENSIWNFVNRNSPFMAHRLSTYNKDIMNAERSLKATPRSHAMDLWRKSMYYMMGKSQQLVDTVTWTAAYKKAIQGQAGKNIAADDNDAAVQYADQVVRRAQSSGVFSDRTAMERGTLNRNVRQTEIAKIWTTLGSYMFTKANAVYEATRKADFKSPVGIAKWTADMAMLLTFETLAYNAIYNLWPSKKEHESDASYIGRFGAYALGQTAATAFDIQPFLRGVPSEVQGFRGGSALATVYQDTGKPIKRAEKGKIDGTFAKDMNTLGGIFFHYPSSQMNQTIGTMFDALDNNQNVSPVDYLLYQKKHDK